MERRGLAPSLTCRGTKAATPQSRTALTVDDPPKAAYHAVRRLNEAEAHGTVHRISRSRRLLRWGPDGPESQRPSDATMVEPMALHPRPDAYGVVRHGE